MDPARRAPPYAVWLVAGAVIMGTSAAAGPMTRQQICEALIIAARRHVHFHFTDPQGATARESLIPQDIGVGKTRRTAEERAAITLAHTDPKKLAEERAAIAKLMGPGGVCHYEPPPADLPNTESVKLEASRLTGPAKESYDAEVEHLVDQWRASQTKITPEAEAKAREEARLKVATLTFDTDEHGQPRLSAGERSHLEQMARDGRRLRESGALEKALERLDELYVGYEGIAQERHIARFLLENKAGTLTQEKRQELEARLKILDEYYAQVNDAVNLVGNIRQRIEVADYLANGTAVPARVFGSAQALNDIQSPWFTNGVETKRSHDAAGVGILWISKGTPAVRAWALRNGTKLAADVYPGGAWRAPLSGPSKFWNSAQANRNIYSVEGNRSLNMSGVIVPEGEVFATSFTGNRNTQAVGLDADPNALVRHFLTGGGLQSERQLLFFRRGPDGKLERVNQYGQSVKDNAEKLDNWIRNKLRYPGIVPKQRSTFRSAARFTSSGRNGSAARGSRWKPPASGSQTSSRSPARSGKKRTGSWPIRRLAKRRGRRGSRVSISSSWTPA